VAAEVCGDFIFNLVFQEQQQQAQPCPDPDFAFPHRDLAVDTGPVEMNVIADPAVVNIKFTRQVTGQFVRRRLGVVPGHFMVGTHIDIGHDRVLLPLKRISLDARRFWRQSRFFRPGERQQK
jgi:hypothetical protein